MNIQDQFPLGWTGWISLQPKGPSRVFSNTTVQSTVMKHDFVISFNLEQSAFHLMLKSAGLQSSVSVPGSVSVCSFLRDSMQIGHFFGKNPAQVLLYPFHSCNRRIRCSR